MSFIVCKLYSSTLDQYYIGHTADIQDRLFRHTDSGSKSTKKVDDWKLVYTEIFATKSELFLIRNFYPGMKSIFIG